MAKLHYIRLKVDSRSELLGGLHYFAVERECLPDHFVVKTIKPHPYKEFKVLKRDCQIIYSKEI